jgi:peptide/nickel transport system permease protein
MTILLAAFSAAALVRLAPGFGMDERQLDLRLSNSSIQAIQTGHTADTSLVRYFWRYLSGLFRGDLGQSLSLGRPVRDLIAERFGVTLSTIALGLAWAWTTAIAAVFSLGLVRRRFCDLAAHSLSGALLCLPATVVALFSLYLGAGPALATGAILLPRIFRFTSNVTAAAAARPHVLAARARGASGMALLARHVWLPAAPELLALAGVSISMALGAVIPVEALCDSPGVGQLVWKAALARDLPVLVNVTVLIAIVTAVANLSADAAHTAFWREA